MDIDDVDVLHLEEIFWAITHGEDTGDYWSGAGASDVEWLEHFIAKVSGGVCKDCGADFSLQNSTKN